MESFSVSPIHSRLFGVVAMIVDLWSVCCEFKPHKSLFDFEDFFVI